MFKTIFDNCILLLIPLSILSCKCGQNEKVDNTSTSIAAISGGISIDLPDSLQLVTYDYSQLDSAFYSGPYTIGRYFGWQNDNLEDGSIPDIPGLNFRTAMGKHMAIRCPRDKGVLKWTSYRFKLFADWVKHGPGDTIPSVVKLYEQPKSDIDIIEHYIPELVSDPQDINFEPSDSMNYNEQFAILITDICSNKKYVTMEEYTWYDCNSCGDNTAFSWFTIDKDTGSVLELSDIIYESKWQEFAFIMIKHLNDGHPWLNYNRDTQRCDLIKILNERDGCAITPEGVIVYYHPYKIGCGAEGQYNALIPYDELKGLIKTRI